MNFDKARLRRLIFGILLAPAVVAFGWCVFPIPGLSLILWGVFFHENFELASLVFISELIYVILILIIVDPFSNILD